MKCGGEEKCKREKKTSIFFNKKYGKHSSASSELIVDDLE
jgi:hypothetical protein